MPAVRVPALIALEDGRCFMGNAFGARGTATGELCVNSLMCGYQEVVTDPSGRGQIVAMTYPEIGNCGVNGLDAESAKAQIRGLVVGELEAVPSNFRSDGALGAYLAEQGVPGIEGVDTRALAIHLREHGAMRACLSTELEPAAAVEAAKAAAPLAGTDLVSGVSTESAYPWQGESRRWRLPNLSTGETSEFEELPPVRFRIVAYDFGVKFGLLRRLRQAGFETEVVPCGTPAAEVLAKNPDGVLLSNGPGDPAGLAGIHREIRALAGRVPLFGVCLGNLLLAHAFGARSFKLKCGHHGGNHPVKDLGSGKVSITVQNHGFAVDPETLPADLEVTHVNLNDDSIEGLRHRSLPVFGVQYHPEAASGPADVGALLGIFAEMIGKHRSKAG